MKELLLGLAVGAVVAGGAVKLWSNGQIDSTMKDYMADEQELNHLKMENSTLRATLKSRDNNAYSRDEIKTCIMMDGLRSNAMSTYLAGRTMSDLERGAFRDFGPMLESIANKSSQTKLVELAMENAKLTDECLDRARIPMPAIAKD